MTFIVYGRYLMMYLRQEKSFLWRVIDYEYIQTFEKKDKRNQY